MPSRQVNGFLRKSKSNKIELVARPEVDLQKAEAAEDSESSSSEPEKPSKADEAAAPAAPPSAAEAPSVGGLGASLFGTSDEPMGAPPTDDSIRKAIFGDGGGEASGTEEGEGEGGGGGGGTTGDAIFSDMPAVPNIASTGAAIFGVRSGH